LYILNAPTNSCLLISIYELAFINKRAPTEADAHNK
jgi:hypothetical protein